MGKQAETAAKKPRLTAPTPAPNTATPAVRRVELPVNTRAKLETDAKEMLAKQQQGGGGGSNGTRRSPRCAPAGLQLVATADQQASWVQQQGAMYHL